MRGQARDISGSLHLGTASSSIPRLVRTKASPMTARLRFEAFINKECSGWTEATAVHSREPRFDMASLRGALQQTQPPFATNRSFFLVDEYENFEDYQQQVVNTLIKHSGQWYTFKVGVREFGWRVRSTLNPNEQLVSPADYVRLNITERLEKSFKTFAKSVCNNRLANIHVQDQQVIDDIEAALPTLTEDEEAERLGIRDAVTKFDSEVPGAAQSNELTPLQKYFIAHWAETQHLSIEDAVRDMYENRQQWEVRFGNYKHALLFAIRRGKRGVQKYYCGWDVFTQLAANNIRYLIELVDQSLLHHLRDAGRLDMPVSPEIQTKAAQAVGKKNVSELEGLSVFGAQLTKLVLGLGRIFQVMAAQPFGHAPEVNQFHISEDENSMLLMDLPDDVDRLVKSAVMHLALIRFPANKLAEEGETRDYDYMLHPIFSAFFVFSQRRKRKMVLSASELIGLVRDPHQYIPRILARQNRSADEELPEQVLLFGGYYGRPS